MWNFKKIVAPAAAVLTMAVSNTAMAVTDISAGLTTLGEGSGLIGQIGVIALGAVAVIALFKWVKRAAV